MSTTPDNPPAFPHTRVYNDSTEIAGGVWKESGMTLRDWFAGNALTKLIDDGKDRAGYLASYSGSELEHDGIVSARAYEIADAMLAQRAIGLVAKKGKL